MTTKLITSQAYVDNIRNFLPENPNSKTPTSAKVEKNFNRIINSPNFIFDKSDKRITNDITTLISTRPGRTLFKRLLKADKPLKIVFDSKKPSSLVPPNGETKETTLTLNDSKTFYFISVNSDGEKIFIPGSGFITLAHELIHALHYFEEGVEFVNEKFKNKNLIDPEFGNLEEQETIIGKEGEGTFCENLFRSRFEYPLRINHRGIILNKEDAFTASDCAAAGTLATLKEMLLSNPSLLNLPQQCSLGHKMTPLSASLAARQVEISDYLLQIGADVNAQDNSGTALQMAANTGQYDMVKMLLENGAAVNEKGPHGCTALHFAVNTKQFDIVKMLLENGAAVNEKGPNGPIALHLAVVTKQCDIVKMLLENGAAVNEKGPDGSTALHFATLYGQSDIVKMLLENGAAVNEKTPDGSTALHLAMRYGQSNIVKMLLENGAKIPVELKEKVEWMGLSAK